MVKHLRDIPALGGIGIKQNLTHPIGQEFSMPVDRQVRRLDPNKIIEEGPYIRIHINEEAIERMVETIRAHGVEQPIGIREAGPPNNRRFILIYGKRRWIAARRAGVKDVPVKSYGEFDESEMDRVLALQVLENDARETPHHVDRAYGYHLLIKAGWDQKRIVAETGGDKGEVSVLTRMGEAIAQLTDEQRAKLYTAPDVTYRAFQELCKVKPLEERVRQLLALSEGAAPTIATAVKKRAAKVVETFKPRKHRDGRSFRMRWTDEDLKQRGAALLEEFIDHIVYEHEQLVARYQELASKGELEKKEVQKVTQDLEKLIQKRSGKR